MDDSIEAGSAYDLLRKTSKPAGIVLAIALVAGGGYYFWRQSQLNEAKTAERQLFQAQTALAQGNRPLAESDLQKLITASGSTPAGIRAAAILAELRYDEGKYPEGTALVQKALEKAPDVQKPGLHALLAAGYEDQKKPAEAAAEFQKAADATPYDLDKQKYLADAARSLGAAGKTAEAKKIWSQLAEDELSPTAGEARVRLGELEATPSKS